MENGVVNPVAFWRTPPNARKPAAWDTLKGKPVYKMLSWSAARAKHPSPGVRSIDDNTDRGN
eukprot:2032929-Lingulodinium_polyedra.AAC.1